LELASPEGLRVARELHDGIAQDLVGVGYSLDLLLADPSLSTHSRQEIRRTRLSVDELIAKVRREILNLRTNTSHTFSSEVKRLISELTLPQEVTLSIEEIALDKELTTQLLLITKEILRNSIAHSGATHIGISLYPINNRTCLEVIDDGIGGAHVKDGHFGISGIIERVHAINGNITIESIDGTRVAILI
jgi:signal transduction histidine kinase